VLVVLDPWRPRGLWTLIGLVVFSAIGVFQLQRRRAAAPER